MPNSKTHAVTLECLDIRPLLFTTTQPEIILIQVQSKVVQQGFDCSRLAGQTKGAEEGFYA